MAEKYNRYNITVNTYNQSGVIEIIPRCNGLTVTNIGDDTVTVKGMVLYPGTVGSILGDSRSIGGNANEILYEKRLSISFAGVGVAPNIEVIQKYFIDLTD